MSSHKAQVKVDSLYQSRVSFKELSHESRYAFEGGPIQKHVVHVLGNSKRNILIGSIHADKLTACIQASESHIRAGNGFSFEYKYGNIMQS